jgi:putative transposase
MPRTARVVVPGLPHHVIQRGNRRQPTFFGDDDYDAYRALMAEWCIGYGVQVWAYCLMPNHVHLLLVPPLENALAKAVAGAHRAYTVRVNQREGWSGFLWQGRFASYPLDEAHLALTARYIELNPVRAGIVKQPQDYAWSSARAHLSGEDDGLVQATALLDRHPDWASVLKQGLAEADLELLRKHERSGRPLGDEAFVAGLEERLGRKLRSGRPGRPRRSG